MLPAPTKLYFRARSNVLMNEDGQIDIPQMSEWTRFQYTLICTQLLHSSEQLQIKKHRKLFNDAIEVCYVIS